MPQNWSSVKISYKQQETYYCSCQTWSAISESAEHKSSDWWTSYKNYFLHLLKPGKWLSCSFEMQHFWAAICSVICISGSRGSVPRKTTAASPRTLILHLPHSSCSRHPGTQQGCACFWGNQHQNFFSPCLLPPSPPDLNHPSCLSGDQPRRFGVNYSGTAAFFSWAAPWTYANEQK